MELGLSLGESSKPCFKHVVGLGLNTTLSIGPNSTCITSSKTCSDDHDIHTYQDDHHHEDELEEVKINDKKKQQNHEEVAANTSSLDNHNLQLHLLPLSSFPWRPNSDHGK